jgi:hypothetical protein
MTEQPEPDELERVRRETARKVALEAIAVARDALKAARVCRGCKHEPHAPGDCATFYPPHPSPLVPIKCMCDRDLASGPMETPTQEPKREQA